jgi:hypothetical protein
MTGMSDQPPWMPTSERNLYDPGPCPNCASSNTFVAEWNDLRGMSSPKRNDCRDCHGYRTPVTIFEEG